MGNVNLLHMSILECGEMFHKLAVYTVYIGYVYWKCSMLNDIWSFLVIFVVVAADGQSSCFGDNWVSHCGHGLLHESLIMTFCAAEIT